MPAGDPDGALVAAAMGGDVGAFGELVERLHLRVYRFVLGRVHSPTDAEDLTQDTFLEAYSKLAAFRGASRFSTWVTGIALNLVRNHLSRAPERRYAMESDDGLEMLPVGGPGPHEQARSNAFAEAVRQAMAVLSHEAREALALVVVDGLDYHEAAAIVGVPVGTMKTRVFRARRMLKEELRRLGKEDFLTP